MYSVICEHLCVSEGISYFPERPPNLAGCYDGSKYFGALLMIGDEL